MHTRQHSHNATTGVVAFALLFLALLTTLFTLALTVPHAKAQADDEMLITPTSVAGAIVGSTVEELETQLGDEYDIGGRIRITVDFDGHVVSRDGQVQFRAVRAGTGDELNLFIINNEAFKTVDGVGPGTSIAEAEAIWGEATLSWNPEDESREFVRFENQPEGQILFRTPGIAGNNVGVYEDGRLETNEYDPDGLIAAVWISCVPGTDCIDPNGSADTSGDTTDDSNGDDGSDDDGTDDGSGDEGGEDATDTEESNGDGAATESEAGDDGADDSAGEAPAGSGALADTGFAESFLVAAALLLFTIGGAFVIVHRYEFGPRWLQ